MSTISAPCSRSK